MREYILQQLRACSCIRGKQRTWIADLTDEQLYALYLRLRNGENAKSIARIIQSTWGINPESSPHSISQGILKFKKRIAHFMIYGEGERDYAAPVNQNFNPEDTLASLDHIANLHRARIKTMLEEEENTGVKYPYLNRDLQALATLQKLIIKQKVFEMLHNDPVKQRKLAGLEKDIQHKFDLFMGQIGEDERIKMAEVLGNALEYFDKIAIPGEIGPDGKVRLIESKNDSQGGVPVGGIIKNQGSPT